MATANRNWIKLLAGVAVVVIAAVAYFSLSSRQPAPQVTYTDLTGQKITSDSLKGKVVMVNFWATSCVTCIKEMPQMVQTYNKYKDQGLEFVAVAMSYDPPAYVANFAKTRQLPFSVAIDNTGNIARSFGDVKLTPTTFLINKRGEIVKRYVGAPDFAALHTLVEKLLAEQA